MSARDDILDLLVEAATRRANAATRQPALFRAPPPEVSPAADPSDREAVVARFSERLRDVKGEPLRAPDSSAALAALRDLLFRWEVRGAVLSPDPLVLDLRPDALLAERGIPVQWLDGGASEAAWREELAAAALANRAPNVPWDLAILGCQGAIAETGSIIHRVAPGRGRGGWLLCQSQLVILDQEQIVPDLEGLFVPGGALDRQELPRAITAVTGPSRTADIEQTLTVGVHGPGRFAALVIG